MPKAFWAGLFLSSLVCLSATAAPVTQVQPDKTRLARFNALLKQAPEFWRQDPLYMALFWAGQTSSAKRNLVFQAFPPENPIKASVQITDEGLLDDAISGHRLNFRFQKLQGSWQLTEVQEFWQCHRGAQPQSFVTGLCP